MVDRLHSVPTNLFGAVYLALGEHRDICLVSFGMGVKNWQIIKLRRARFLSLCCCIFSCLRLLVHEGFAATGAAAVTLRNS